ncbi:hypothetical protein NL676_024944 [Syzygium grande]|nr:hypothetical protein NL676_024944 [Syzygium grande]
MAIQLSPLFYTCQGADRRHVTGDDELKARYFRPPKYLRLLPPPFFPRNNNNNNNSRRRLTWRRVGGARAPRPRPTGSARFSLLAFFFPPFSFVVAVVAVCFASRVASRGEMTWKAPRENSGRVQRVLRFVNRREPPRPSPKLHRSSVDWVKTNPLGNHGSSPPPRAPGWRSRRVP